jgi:signal transduction histidine kinase
VLAVSDDGPGLPDQLVLERGNSGGESTGLGLDIVRRAAERSGGTLRLGRVPGRGTTATVEFGPPHPR